MDTPKYRESHTKIKVQSLYNKRAVKLPSVRWPAHAGNCLLSVVLIVWVDGHGRRPGTYFQGWTLSSHFLGQCSLDGVHVVNKISTLYRWSRTSACKIKSLVFPL